MVDIIKSKALSFLAKREYSYKELFHKLKRYSADETAIHVLLTDLQQKGWLSEERFIQNYAASKSSKYGSLRIKQALLQKTDDHELVEQIIKTNLNGEYNVALKLWQKKFGEVTHDPKELAKQIRFLQNKGFTYDIIRKVVKNIPDI